MIKVVNNFLDSEDFKKLKETTFKADFYYASEVSGLGANDGFYFIHMIYSDHRIFSPLFPLIEPILNKLNVKALHRAKVNLFTKNNKLIEYGQHTDTDFKCKTFLISLNTCNGFTRIGKDKTIPSVENTGIYFPANILHNSTNCTDENVRVNININYF